MSGAVRWIDVCADGELGEEEVIGVEHDRALYAVYRTPSGLYATDGLCTHEFALLADGLVMGDIIECPLHQGRFHIPTGEAKSPPVCENLKTYSVRVENGRIQLGLPA
ncbi:MAG: non-heme iron oxygenase ferredoxin subunit [Rhodospirillaceae bacterium]|nr:non-heme iron oxygenase ferredoxin subunit [Rhodospirillaceae bacterium]